MSRQKPSATIPRRVLLAVEAPAAERWLEANAVRALETEIAK